MSDMKDLQEKQAVVAMSLAESYVRFIAFMKDGSMGRLLKNEMNHLTNMSIKFEELTIKIEEQELEEDNDG